MSDTKCSRCQHLQARWICGADDSVYFGQEVSADYSCPAFRHNPAQDHYTLGLKCVFGEENDRAVIELQKALQGDLPEDNQIMAKAALGSVFLAGEQRDIGMAYLEEALALDESGEYGVFEDPLQRKAWLPDLERAYWIRSVEISETQTPQEAIVFLQEKLNGLSYLPQTPGLWSQMGFFYKETGQIDNARQALERAVKTEPLTELGENVRLEARDNLEKLKAGTSEGCFLASTVYGDSETRPVTILRAYRDQFLLPHLLGRLVIRVY